MCQSLFFNKVAGLSPVTLSKRDSHRCFPVNFAKFLRTPFLQNSSGGCFCFFRVFLEFFLLFFDDVMDEECEYFKIANVQAHRVMLSFCLMFCQFQPSVKSFRSFLVKSRELSNNRGIFRTLLNIDDKAF